jgi:LmbE family N-acetylglucosaminyl deacetylase
MIKRGDSVTMCNLCSGNMGHAVIPPAELKETRLKESRNSAAAVGAKHITADIDDLGLYHQNKAARDKTADVIRSENPELIITHHPGDYMADHVAASRLVFDASFCTSLPHYKTDCAAVTAVCPIYYMDNLGAFNFEPTEYVDVSDEIDIKLKMLSCHESQFKWMKEHDGVDFFETVKTFSRMRGLQAGVKYAEGFIQMKGWGRMTTKRLLP